MSPGRQEDAHEFLRYLVDGLQDACLHGFDKLDKITKGTTMVNSIFSGLLRNSVTCQQCGYVSLTHDPMMDLCLEIKHASTLQKALRQFTKGEKLSIENAYKCARCKKKVAAVKQMVIQKAPTVLTIQLKRFDFFSKYGGKLNKHVEFPTDLDLAPLMTKSKRGKPIGYSLYAVLVHAGHSVQSGHYYAFVKSPSGSWYRMDDDSVSMVKLSTVLAQRAYILFYLRKSLDPKPAPTASTPAAATAAAAAAPSPKQARVGTPLDTAKGLAERLKTVKAAMPVALASAEKTPAATAEKTSTKKKAAGVTEIFDQFDQVQAAACSSDDDDDDDEAPTVKNKISERKAQKVAKQPADEMLLVDEPVICTHGGWEATYYFPPKETVAPAQAREIAEETEETEMGWDVSDIVSPDAGEAVAGADSADAASSNSSSGDDDDSNPTGDEEESSSDEDAESSEEDSADSEDGEVTFGTSRKRPVKVVEWDAQLNEDGSVAKRQKPEGVSLSELLGSR